MEHPHQPKLGLVEVKVGRRGRSNTHRFHPQDRGGEDDDRSQRDKVSLRRREAVSPHEGADDAHRKHQLPAKGIEKPIEPHPSAAGRVDCDGR